MPVGPRTWWLVLVAALLGASSAYAQDPPPRIGLWSVDVRGSVPRFTRDQAVAASRGLDVRELPGTGLGVDVGAHVYPFAWKAVTFGIGGQATFARAALSPGEGQGLRAVRTRFTSLAPQLSFNFGTGDGWSYLSGGIGSATWSIVPEQADPGAADEERIATVNYGGGARWFIKPRLAFTFDVRFYARGPGTPAGARPATPRTTLFFASAGISVRPGDGR